MGEIKAVNPTSDDTSWIWAQLETHCETDPDHRMVTLHSPQTGYVRSRGRFQEIILGMATWLRSAGIEAGDYVAVASSLRSEVLIIWLACLHIGAVTVFYPSDMKHADCVADADQRKARIVVVEAPENVKTWLDSRSPALPNLHAIVYMDNRCANGTMVDKLLGWPLPNGVVSLESCLESKAPKPLRPHIYAPQTPCTVVFSQGTTRGERAIILSQEMLKIQAMDLITRLKIQSDDTVLYVPQTVCATMLSVFSACICSGATFAMTHAFLSAPLGIVEQIQPNIIFMLPNAMHTLAGIMLTESARTKLHSNWNRFCMLAGKFRNRHKSQYMALPNRMIDNLCLRHLKNRLGAFCRAIVSFGTNLDHHDAEFFSYLDIPVYNGYTVSEAGGFVHLHAFDGGGGFLSSCKVRISKGILSLCPAGQSTYFSTGDCVFEDQRTGLCVRRIERVTLSDVSKLYTMAVRDILVRESVIEEILIYGEGRPYLTALIYLDVQALKSWAAEQKIGKADNFEALCQNAKVYQYVKSRIDACNANRTGNEEIRKIALLPVPLAEEPRVLTYAGLFRQYEVEQKYAGILESFYNDNF